MTKTNQRKRKLVASNSFDNESEAYQEVFMQGMSDMTPERIPRGIETEEAVSLMVNGFCKEVFNELPLEFASEADRLLSLKLEGSVG